MFSVYTLQHNTIVEIQSRLLILHATPRFAVAPGHPGIKISAEATVGSWGSFAHIQQPVFILTVKLHSLLYFLLTPG